MKDEKEQSGKNQLIVLLCSIVLIQILFISIFHFRGKDDKQIARIVRLIIIGALSIGTYQKSITTKWLLVAYLTFNGLAGFYRLDSLTNYFLIVFSFIYLLMAALILFSKNINLYLSYKTKRDS